MTAIRLILTHPSEPGWLDRLTERDLLLGFAVLSPCPLDIWPWHPRRA
jgi:hypothetical protein